MLVAAVGAAVLVVPAGPGLARAPVSREVVEVRSVPGAELGVRRPTGVTYSAGDETLVVTRDAGRGSAAVTATTAGERRTRLSLPDVPDGGTVASDPSTGRLTAVAPDLLVESPAGGGAGDSTDASGLRVDDPAGATFDAAGTLHVLDAANGTLVSVDGGEPATGDVTRTELTGLDGARLTGLAYDSATEALYVAEPSRDLLHRLSDSGEVTATYDLSRTSVQTLEAMTFAPTADPTDDPQETHLFVADSGTTRTLGSVTEISLAAAETLAVSDLDAAFVRATATSTWADPSPDSSGVAYIPGEDRLAVDDGEIEETVAPHTQPLYWQGKNLFYATRTGAYVGGGSTLAYSDEPVGLAFDSTRNRLVVSDDDKKTVSVVGKGSDGFYGTAGAFVRSFGTRPFGNVDPEGVEVDPQTGDYWVVDALSRDVYRLRPGPNGQVDGGGDDVITSFDVGTLNGQTAALDPEGISFDPVRETVLVLDDNTHAIYELTRGGTLLNVIGIPAARAFKAAGLALAPASDGSGVTHYYVVDRGVDNDNDPTANDGQVIEFRPPPSLSEPVANGAPVVNAGPDQVVQLPAAGSVSGSVTDDGYPDPAGLTTTWSKQSGPGTVTFANANAASTTATFGAEGTYTLRLTADDGAATGFDDVVVTVVQNRPPEVTGVTGDETVYQPDAAHVSGTVTDDGYPKPPGAVTTTWSKASGPGQVTFADPNALSTTATFSEPGTYALRLTADDGALSDSTSLVVSVLHNEGPTVNAGPDRSVELPDPVLLSGTVVDDGLPDPPGEVTTTWSELSGPGEVTFEDESALSTHAEFSEPGTYLLRLSADDGRTTRTDEVEVSVTSRAYAFGAGTSEAGTAEVVTRVRKDGPLRHREWSRTGGLGAASSLGGRAHWAPAVVEAGSTVYVFMTSRDRRLRYKTRTDGTWSGWHGLGFRATSGPGAVVTAKTVQVFVRGRDGDIHRRRMSRTHGTWSRWQDLGGPARWGKAPAVAYPAGATLELVIHGRDHKVWRRTKERGTPWSRWRRFGTLTIKGAPSAASERWKEFTVVVRGDDNRVWAKQADRSGVDRWRRIGPAVRYTPAAVAKRGSRALHVLAYNRAGLLIRRTREDGAWTSWTRAD